MAITSPAQAQQESAASNEQPSSEQPSNEQPGNEQPGNERPGSEQPGNEQPPLIERAPSESERPALPEGLSRLPLLTNQVDSEYPPLALEEAVQADVMLEITVSELGHVSDVVALGLTLYLFDSEDELFEQALLPEEDPYGFVDLAIEAMLGATFRPAQDDDGLPVPVRIVWRFGFYFDDEEVEVPADDEAVVEMVNLAGQVLERGTRDPVVGVDIVVWLGDFERTASTDGEGRFEFVGLAPGAWAVRVDAFDYQPLEVTEEVREGERTEVTYRVERETYSEYTYEVRADAVPREVSRQTLSVIEISRIPGNSGDAIRVVENLPGVARAAPFSGEIIVRGSAPEDTGVFLEGVNIPLAFHFGGLSAVVNSDLLQKLEFIPGAYSAEYGRATGGIINIDLRTPRRDAIHGYADIDLFDGTLLIEGPISDEWAFALSGRRSWIDAVLQALPAEDLGIALTTAPRYWDFQAMLQYDPSVEHSFNLLLYGSDDRLELVVEEPDDPMFRGDVGFAMSFYGVQFEWLAEFSDRVSNRALASFGHQSASAVAGADLNFDLTVFPRIIVRDTLEIRPTPSLRLRPGLDIGIGWYGVDATLPDFDDGDEGGASGSYADLLVDLGLDTVFAFYPAVFFEAEWDIVEQLMVVPGVRLDVSDDFEHTTVDVRFATRYAVTDGLTLKGALGTFHQPPQPYETIEEFGNPELEPEGATHYVVGGEYDITDVINVDLQVFYKDLYGLIESSDELVERDGELVDERLANTGQGRAYGLELLLRHRTANGFFGWIAYTLSRSERRPVPSEPWQPFEYDQTHILTVLGSYDLGRNWTVGARFRYVTGNLDTPVIGATYDVTDDSYIAAYGEPNSVRVDAFHQLDIRVDKTWIFDAWTFNLYLDIQNTYNRGNVEAMGYNYDFSQQRPTTGLPIVPSLGFRGSF